jgi:hypothetical protein
MTVLLTLGKESSPENLLLQNFTVTFLRTFGLQKIACCGKVCKKNRYCSVAFRQNKWRKAFLERFGHFFEPFLKIQQKCILHLYLLSYVAALSAKWQQRLMNAYEE